MVNSGTFDTNAIGQGDRNAKINCTHPDADVASDSVDASCSTGTCTSTAEGDIDAYAPFNDESTSNKIVEENADETITEEDKSTLCCSVPLEKVQGVLNFHPPVCEEPKPTRKLLDSKRKDMVRMTLLCLYCERSFASANLRQKHVERVHSVKKNRRLSFRKQNQLTITPCIYCEKLNTTENTLKDLFQHLIKEHSNNYFGCLPCEERFLTSSLLSDHKASQHPTVSEIPDKKPAKLTPTDDDTDDDKEGSLEKEITVKLTRSKTKPKADSTESSESAKKAIRNKSTKLKELRNKKLTVKSSRIALNRRESKRLQAISDAQKKKRQKPVERTNGKQTSVNKTETLPEKSSCVNPYPEFDHFYRVKKITDHSIDNLKISSLTFDDVFDKTFFNRIKCNIEENLLHHIDGKLFKNEESESRISNFEKVSTMLQEVQNSAPETYGCELSLNAVTPVASLSLNSQFGEDFESQIEYGSKPSKKKTQIKKDEVHYKYFTRRKFQASILEQTENRDLSKLDMWTQLVIKKRQQKIIDDKKSAKEIQEYSTCDEYKNKIRREELNRILDRRGPFEDLREEASKKAALDKLNSDSRDSISHESFTEVREVLNEILNRVFAMTEEICKHVEEQGTSRTQTPSDTKQDLREIPSFLNLRRSTSLPNEGEIDQSDKITLICSSQDTENFELPTNQARGKNELIELSGEWARCRMYICAACGAKLPNMRYLLDHKTIYHQNVWVQHYEFVGNQSELYRHLSIPVLGKVGYIEDSVQCKTWKRSDARMCTKCAKQCNTLGELHRHILECGGDWTWMLARKKCKYRYGAKSRRKRRGLVVRVDHQKRKTDTTEKKKYKYDGPRQRPSDAETIQRMLANLPAKRSTRKLISLYDGVRRKRKKQELEKVKQKKVKCGKVIYSKSSNIKETTEKTINAAVTHKPQKNGQSSNMRSLRSLNRVLSSRILDTNTKLSVKRKLKVLNERRRTRQSSPAENNIQTYGETSQSSSQSRKKTDKAEVNGSGIIPKRTSPRSNKIVRKMTVKKLLTGNINIKSFFPVKKRKGEKEMKEEVIVEKNVDIKTRSKKKSNELEEKEENEMLDGKAKKIEKLVRKSPTEDSREDIKAKKSHKLGKIVRSLSMNKKKSSKKAGQDEIAQTASEPAPLKKTSNKEDLEQNKRKRTLKQSFKNVINRVKRLKIDNAPETVQTNDKDQPSTTKSPFLDEANREKDPVKIIIPSTAEAKENIADISETAHTVITMNETNEDSLVPENIFKLDSNNEKYLQAKCESDLNSQLSIEQTQPVANITKAEDPPVIGKKDMLQPISVETSVKSKIVPMISPNMKGKIRKPSRGLNDCIAMLTSKLQLKTNDDVSKLKVLPSVTTPKIISDSLPQKTECILKIPTFKTQMENFEDVALDLSIKSRKVDSDLPIPLTNNYRRDKEAALKFNNLTSVETIIENVVNNKLNESRAFDLPPYLFNSIDQTIQTVIDGHLKAQNVKTLQAKTSVDDIIEYVINFDALEQNNLKTLRGNNMFSSLKPACKSNRKIGSVRRLKKPAEISATTIKTNEIKLLKNKEPPDEATSAEEMDPALNRLDITEENAKKTRKSKSKLKSVSENLIETNIDGILDAKEIVNVLQVPIKSKNSIKVINIEDEPHILENKSVFSGKIPSLSPNKSIENEEFEEAKEKPNKIQNKQNLRHFRKHNKAVVVCRELCFFKKDAGTEINTNDHPTQSNQIPNNKVEQNSKRKISTSMKISNKTNSKITNEIDISEEEDESSKITQGLLASIGIEKDHQISDGVFLPENVSTISLETKKKKGLRKSRFAKKKLKRLNILPEPTNVADLEEICLNGVNEINKIENAFDEKNGISDDDIEAQIEITVIGKPTGNKIADSPNNEQGISIDGSNRKQVKEINKKEKKNSPNKKVKSKIESPPVAASSNTEKENLKENPETKCETNTQIDSLQANPALEKPESDTSDDFAKESRIANKLAGIKNKSADISLTNINVTLPTYESNVSEQKNEGTAFEVDEKSPSTDTQRNSAIPDVTVAAEDVPKSSSNEDSNEDFCIVKKPEKMTKRSKSCNVKLDKTRLNPKIILKSLKTHSKKKSRNNSKRILHTTSSETSLEKLNHVPPVRLTRSKSPKKAAIFKPEVNDTEKQMGILMKNENASASKEISSINADQTGQSNIEDSKVKLNEDKYKQILENTLLSEFSEDFLAEVSTKPEEIVNVSDRKEINVPTIPDTALIMDTKKSKLTKRSSENSVTEKIISNKFDENINTAPLQLPNKSSVSLDDLNACITESSPNKETESDVAIESNDAVPEFTTKKSVKRSKSLSGSLKKVDTVDGKICSDKIEETRQTPKYLRDKLKLNVKVTSRRSRSLKNCPVSVDCLLTEENTNLSSLETDTLKSVELLNLASTFAENDNPIDDNDKQNKKHSDSNAKKPFGRSKPGRKSKTPIKNLITAVEGDTTTNKNFAHSQQNTVRMEMNGKKPNTRSQSPKKAYVSTEEINESIEEQIHLDKVEESKLSENGSIKIKIKQSIKESSDSLIIELISPENKEDTKLTSAYAPVSLESLNTPTEEFPTFRLDEIENSPLSERLEYVDSKITRSSKRSRSLKKSFDPEIPVIKSNEIEEQLDINMDSNINNLIISSKSLVKLSVEEKTYCNETNEIQSIPNLANLEDANEDTEITKTPPFRSTEKSLNELEKQKSDTFCETNNVTEALNESNKMQTLWKDCLLEEEIDSNKEENKRKSNYASKSSKMFSPKRKSPKNPDMSDKINSAVVCDANQAESLIMVVKKPNKRQKCLNYSTKQSEELCESDDNLVESKLRTTRSNYKSPKKSKDCKSFDDLGALISEVKTVKSMENVNGNESVPTLKIIPKNLKTIGVNGKDESNEYSDNSLTDSDVKSKTLTRRIKSLERSGERNSFENLDIDDSGFEDQTIIPKRKSGSIKENNAKQTSVGDVDDNNFADCIKHVTKRPGRPRNKLNNTALQCSSSERQNYMLPLNDLGIRRTRSSNNISNTSNESKLNESLDAEVCNIMSQTEFNIPDFKLTRSKRRSSSLKNIFDSPFVTESSESESVLQPSPAMDQKSRKPGRKPKKSKISTPEEPSATDNSKLESISNDDFVKPSNLSKSIKAVYETNSSTCEKLDAHFNKTEPNAKLDKEEEETSEASNVKILEEKIRNAIRQSLMSMNNEEDNNDVQSTTDIVDENVISEECSNQRVVDASELNEQFALRDNEKTNITKNASPVDSSVLEVDTTVSATTRHLRKKCPINYAEYEDVKVTNELINSNNGNNTENGSDIKESEGPYIESDLNDVKKDSLDDSSEIQNKEDKVQDSLKSAVESETYILKENMPKNSLLSTNNGVNKKRTKLRAKKGKKKNKVTQKSGDVDSIDESAESPVSVSLISDSIFKTNEDSTLLASLPSNADPVEKEPPIKIIINKQKTRRKSKNTKKVGIKAHNDLFEDFSMVIKKKRIITFSPPNIFSNEDTFPMELHHVQKINVHAKEGLNDFVQEMDMELDEIPIETNIIETPKLDVILTDNYLVDAIFEGAKINKKKKGKSKKVSNNFTDDDVSSFGEVVATEKNLLKLPLLKLSTKLNQDEDSYEKITPLISGKDTLSEFNEDIFKDRNISGNEFEEQNALETSHFVNSSSHILRKSKKYKKKGIKKKSKNHILLEKNLKENISEEITTTSLDVDFLLNNDEKEKTFDTKVNNGDTSVEINICDENNSSTFAQKTDGVEDDLNFSNETNKTVFADLAIETLEQLDTDFPKPQIKVSKREKKKENNKKSRLKIPSAEIIPYDLPSDKINVTESDDINFTTDSNSHSKIDDIRKEDIDKIYAFSETEDIELERPIELHRRIPRKNEIDEKITDTEHIKNSSTKELSKKKPKIITKETAKNLEKQKDDFNFSSIFSESIDEGIKKPTNKKQSTKEIVSFEPENKPKTITAEAEVSGGRKSMRTAKVKALEHIHDEALAEFTDIEISTDKNINRESHTLEAVSKKSKNKKKCDKNEPDLNFHNKINDSGDKGIIDEVTIKKISTNATNEIKTVDSITKKSKTKKQPVPEVVVQKEISENEFPIYDDISMDDIEISTHQKVEEIKPVDTVGKKLKNKKKSVKSVPSFDLEVLNNEAPLLEDLVAELDGFDELDNSIERELRDEMPLERDGKYLSDQIKEKNDSVVEGPIENVLTAEESQELRRSRRGSRKVTSYNENDLIDPLIDAIEMKRKNRKKEEKNVGDLKQRKEPERKLNSEELFDLLKASTNDNIYVPKQQNSFLTNLEDSSRDVTDENFDNMFENMLEKSAFLAQEKFMPRHKEDIAKLYEFTNNSSDIVEDESRNSIIKKSRKVLEHFEPVFITHDSNSESKSKSDKFESNYCEICNKSFVKLENLIKHRRTLTHIQKLSEIEAKEAEKSKIISRHEDENSRESVIEPPSLIESVENVENVNLRTNLIESKERDIQSSFSTNSSLKLADIINDVLNKPVLPGVDEKPNKFSEIILQNNDTKRYKSLGERKSFDSDTLINSETILTEPFESKTKILETQISLLENIIDNQTAGNYIDDISLSSEKSDTHSEIRSPILIKPTSDDNGFLKPTQYEEISEDSANLRNYDDQKLRKTLNRDEELFLECCSLLKSSSEVSSSYSNKKMQGKVVGILGLKQVDEPEWMEKKNLILDQDLVHIHDYSDNSRIPTPLGNSYDDDDSDSNTISSNWGMETIANNRKNIDTRLTFENISEEQKDVGLKFEGILSNERADYEQLDSENSNSFKGSTEELSDSSINDNKKVMTKGARKVFEGLKVSIPTEELNLEEVLNCSPKQKKLDLIVESVTEEEKLLISPTQKSRNCRKSKPVKKAQVGSNLLFKVSKKKLPSPTISNNEIQKDVYDFEETQDNTDVFTKPDFKAFRNMKSGEHGSETESGDIDSLEAASEFVIANLSPSNKKSKAQENITKKKCMIMGRIFKNAAKSKIEDIDEEIRKIPEIDNDELVENYVADCSKLVINESKHNLEIDDDDDDDLEEQDELENDLKHFTKSKFDCKKQENKRKIKHKGRKRLRTNSDSTDDEFGLNKSAKKRASKKNIKEENNVINLEQELKECIGVASRKSQRKCTSGKQNVLVEYWSSDDSQFEALLEKQIIEVKHKEKLSEITIEQPPEKPTQVLENTLLEEDIKKSSEIKKVKKKSITLKKKSKIEEMTVDGATVNRRKRAAANPLYHWSSSSEDEASDLIEVKPLRDEIEDDEDRPVQHGWIVGDSPKKLVTMLAQAKGKKADVDCVKEQGKKRTNTVS